MGNLEKAIEKIKSLQCPTGEMEKRIAEILEEYKVASRDEIRISKEEKEEVDDLQAYRAKISENKGHITILSESGLDDYVEVVVDAFAE